MVDLTAKTPCDGLLPVTIGPFELVELDLGRLTSLAPYAGMQKALSEALQSAHDVDFPAPNESSQNGDVRIIWFGRNTALLASSASTEAFAEHAALTDQSDAWAAVTLKGAGADQVLARLSPADLRLTVFPADRTCRTLLGHMNVSITKTSDTEFLILVFRSMAITLVDELQEAMEAVAARG